MDFSFVFFINSALLGIGLAMDAFSVSMANGLSEPRMKLPRMCSVAGVYSIFQAAMPLIGWLCAHSIIAYFSFFERCIPFIALSLLGFIGVKMLVEGIRGKKEDEGSVMLTLPVLLLQGVATSIDALSVGFTIAAYGYLQALVCALIICVVTFVICIAGLAIGKKFGTFLSGKATIFGGIILILIGIEIFIKGIIA